MRANGTEIDSVGDLEIQVVQGGPQIVVHLCGELDDYTAPRLRALLFDLIDSHRGRDFALELGELRFIDSTGISVVVGALKRLRAHGRSLTLVDPTPSVYQVLEITGLTQVFEIVRS